jgi:hypothetical protein
MLAFVAAAVGSRRSACTPCGARNTYKGLLGGRVAPRLNKMPEDDNAARNIGRAGLSRPDAQAA